MKQLRTSFTSRGFNHEQVVRAGNLAIYKRWAKNLTAARAHFEVIKISKHNGYKLGSSYIEPAETYPSASVWGIAGWTHTELDTAKERFKELKKYE